MTYVRFLIPIAAAALAPFAFTHRTALHSSLINPTPTVRSVPSDMSDLRWKPLLKEANRLHHQADELESRGKLAESRALRLKADKIEVRAMILQHRSYETARRNLH